MKHLKSQVFHTLLFYSLLVCAVPNMAAAQDVVQDDVQNQEDDILIILENEDWPQDETIDPEQTHDTLTLDAVNVSSDGVSETASQGARPEFSQKLDMPFGLSLNDWLETAPGVFGHTSSKGQRTILIRGFETRHISMEFDGIPLETGYDGMTGLDVLPLNWVGSARLYHADTNPTDGACLGGKVTFYGIQPGKLDATLEISRATVRGSLAHGMTWGDWRWALTTGGHYSNGFYLSQSYIPNSREDGSLRDASNSQSYNFMFKVGRKLQNWGDLEVSAGYVQAPRAVPTGTHSEIPRFWVFPNWNLAYASAKLAFTNSYLSGLVHLWATHQSNLLNEYDDASRTTQDIADARTLWKDQDFGGRLELTSMPFDLQAAGHISALLKADFHWQAHQVTTFNLGQDDTTETQTGRLLYDIRPAFDWQIRPQIRLFASAQATGTAAHISSSSDTATAHTDGGFNVGFDYAILPNLNLGLRTARRLRIPTMKEQFKSEIIGVSLPTLLPEKAWHFELEMHYKPHPRVAMTLAAYDTEVIDLIDFTYLDGIKLAQNIDKSRLAGADVGFKIGPFWHLTLDLTYSYLYAWNLKENHALNDRPAHHFRAALSWTPLDNLRLSIQTQYESKRRTEAWMNSNHAWLGDVILLNAEIEYQMEHLSLLIKGTNLTDYNYMRAVGYPEEGFDLSLSARFTW